MSKNNLGILHLNLTVFYSGHCKAFRTTLLDYASLSQFLHDWSKDTYIAELNFLKNNLIKFP